MHQLVQDVKGEEARLTRIGKRNRDISPVRARLSLELARTEARIIPIHDAEYQIVRFSFASLPSPSC